MCFLVGFTPILLLSIRPVVEKFGTNCNDNCYDFPLLGPKEIFWRWGFFTPAKWNSMPVIPCRPYWLENLIITAYHLVKIFSRTNFSGTSLATNNLKEIYISGWFTGLFKSEYTIERILLMQIPICFYLMHPTVISFGWKNRGVTERWLEAAH